LLSPRTEVRRLYTIEVTVEALPPIAALAPEAGAGSDCSAAFEASAPPATNAVL
jgi:hypothetical protein